MILEAIIKLLEKFIKLGEVREANRQRYMDRYVTPLYHAAEVIYKDYSSLLRQVRRKVQTARKSLPLIQFVENRRLEQLPSRMKLRAILAKTPKKNWTKFEQGILGLIHGCLTENETHQSIYPIGHGDHTLYDIVRRIEYRGDQSLASNRERLLRAVDSQIAGIDEAWKFVCAGYADLQITTFDDLAVPKPYVYDRTGD